MTGGREPRAARVLVVDDAEDLVEILVEQLEPFFRVWAARDGLEAWERVLEERPDVVVTDLVMPGRDGLWLVDQIRGHEQTRAIPVVMLTGRLEDEAKIHAREHGADVYVSKPFRFRELKAALDGLLERKRERVQSFSQESATSMRVLSSGMAHELLNPAGFISNSLYGLEDLVQRLAAGARPPTTEELERFGVLLQAARIGVDRIQALVGELRSMSGGRTQPREPVDLNRALRSSLGLVGVEAQPRIRLHLELAESAVVRGDSGRLNRVLLNLLTNAVQALGEQGGDLWVRTRSEGGDVLTSIVDGGPGISPVNLNRVFDPFFSTKELGVGTGLGLALCRQIVEEHGGTLELASVLGEGTTVSMCLEAAVPDADGGQGPRQLELVSS